MITFVAFLLFALVMAAMIGVRDRRAPVSAPVPADAVTAPSPFAPAAEPSA